MNSSLRGSLEYNSAILIKKKKIVLTYEGYSLKLYTYGFLVFNFFPISCSITSICLTQDIRILINCFEA
jgi:hypothetical protein